MTLLSSYGSDFFDENGRVDINTPEGIAVLQRIRDYSENGYFPPSAETMVIMDNYNLFVNNQLAVYCGSVTISILYDAENMDYGLVNFPSEDGTGFNLVFLSGFAVFGNGDKVTLRAASVNITVNNPNWMVAKAVFYPYIREQLYGKKCGTDSAGN